MLRGKERPSGAFSVPTVIAFETKKALYAEGSATMADEKRELTEQELEQASGGNHVRYEDTRFVYFNAKNQEVGYFDRTTLKDYYVPCDLCGKPMHLGWLGWYCDPCDRRLRGVNYYEWTGTSEELMNAGS